MIQYLEDQSTFRPVCYSVFLALNSVTVDFIMKLPAYYYIVFFTVQISVMFSFSIQSKISESRHLTIYKYILHKSTQIVETALSIFNLHLRVCTCI